MSVPTEEDLQNQFQIESGSKTLLRLYVNSGQLRDAVVDEIQTAIDKYKEARKTLAVSEDVKEKIMMSMMSVEDVGDVKPVIFPNDLADYCQVKHSTPNNLHTHPCLNSSCLHPFQRLTCNAKFSWWGRGRHHCKCCGAVVCKYCSYILKKHH